MPDAQLGLLLLLLNSEWCGVAATFRVVVVKDETICIFVAVGLGEEGYGGILKGSLNSRAAMIKLFI